MFISDRWLDFPNRKPACQSWHDQITQLRFSFHRVTTNPQLLLMNTLTISPRFTAGTHPHCLETPFQTSRKSREPCIWWNVSEAQPFQTVQMGCNGTEVTWVHRRKYVHINVKITQESDTIRNFCNCFPCTFKFAAYSPTSIVRLNMHSCKQFRNDKEMLKTHYKVINSLQSIIIVKVS